jgi:Raf kinase inhibitor-like YbhB/YbcL family protein
MAKNAPEREHDQDSDPPRTAVPPDKPGPASSASASFLLTSPDVADGQTLGNAQLYSGMGCTGQNVSPVLEWRGAPGGTKSFAVTLYDPDAPTGSGWWHWVVFNIPASVTKLAAGAGDPGRDLLPPGARQGNTDFGKPGYGGACPPKGDKPHRYVFTVHALDVGQLDIPPHATAAFVGFSMHGHVLAKATLTALYGR